MPWAQGWTMDGTGDWSHPTKYEMLSIRGKIQPDSRVCFRQQILSDELWT
jgi:hypothetical protein